MHVGETGKSGGPLLAYPAFMAFRDTELSGNKGSPGRQIANEDDQSYGIWAHRQLVKPKCPLFLCRSNVHLRKRAWSFSLFPF